MANSYLICTTISLFQPYTESCYKQASICLEVLILNKRWLLEEQVHEFGCSRNLYTWNGKQ